VLGPDGLSWFEELRRREAARTAILYAFDLIEHDGEDLRNLPYWDRKAPLAAAARYSFRDADRKGNCFASAIMAAPTILLRRQVCRFPMSRRWLGADPSVRDGRQQH
jgi:hypothetical protein